MDRLRHQHEATGDVAGREHVLGRCPEKGVDPDITACIGLDASGGQIQPGSVRNPANRDHGDLRFSTVPRAVVRKDHPHAARRRLERFDRPQALSHHDA